MRIQFDLTGSSRKALVTKIGQELGLAHQYLGTPTYAYAIGPYVLSREGVLEGPDNEDLKEQLSAFVEINGETCSSEALNTSDGKQNETVVSYNGLCIELPLDDLDNEGIARLRKIIDSKATLIKKAIGAVTVDFELTDTTLRFPWFNQALDHETLEAVLSLITALCHHAKEVKYVTAREKPVENEKFAFRVFLIRLGFVGDNYKRVRKILLRNLTGNAAFKH